jgi:hypothetical protein
MSKTKTKRKKYLQKSKRTFSKKDYNSGDGMLTTAWGPAIWHYLHMMSFNYPMKPTEEDKKHYRDFILNLQYVLPCKYCRMNLTKNFERLPLKESDMENRETFSKYVYDLHELINKMLKKKIHLSYADVRERYEHFRSRCSKDELMQKTMHKDPTKDLAKDPTIKGSTKDLTKDSTKDPTIKDSVKDPSTKDPTKKSESGCTESLHGKKSKCIINIVPQEDKRDSFQMHKKCLKTRKK